MKVSPEFMNFGQRFFQDIKSIGETMDEMVKFVLSPFDGGKRTRLRSFIDGTLQDNVSDADLLVLWNPAPAEIYFHSADGLHHMLRKARDRL